MPVTTLTTPGGNPASFISFARFRTYDVFMSKACIKRFVGSALTPKGDFSLDLMMIQLPVAMAGATFMANMIRETFQGMIPATTPKGCFRVKVIMPGELRLEVPATWRAIDAC